MSANECGFCGRDPAEGFATINDRRYCHGDWYPTCYMLASWKDAGTLDFHLRPELKMPLLSAAVPESSEHGA